MKPNDAQVGQTYWIESGHRTATDRELFEYCKVTELKDDRIWGYWSPSLPIKNQRKAYLSKDAIDLIRPLNNKEKTKLLFEAL